MLISEKQIMVLMHFASEYRKELIQLKESKYLTHEGEKQLDQINDWLGAIYNQQSEILKEIE